MTESQHLDPERLAAFLDGRLGDAEAAAVRAQLALADDDTLSAFADAAAITAEIGARPESGGRTDTPVIRIDSAPRVRRWLTAAAAVAAVMVGMVVLRPKAQSSAFKPSLYADLIAEGVTTSEDPVWPASRGASDVHSEAVIAVRIGVLLTDIEVGLRRGHSTRTLILTLASTVQQLNGGVAVSLPLRALVDGTASPARQPIEQLGQQAIAAADSTLVHAGAYLEAARLAAAQGDTTFFDRAGPNELAGLAQHSSVDDATRSMLTRVLAMLAARPRDAKAIHVAVDSLLRALTR